MVIVFFVLKGEFVGKYYDCLEDVEDYMIIWLMIDDMFGVGGYLIVFDEKDNVYWFKVNEEGSFVFNIYVLNVDLEVCKGG